MQPINRVCFEIPKQEHAGKPAFDAVVYRVLDWLKRRPFVSDPGTVLDLDRTMAETGVGDGTRVQSVVLEQEGIRGWGVRYTHRDRAIPELQWIGDVSVFDDGGGRVFYQNTIGVLHTGDAVAPYEVRRSNPSLNREIVDEFRCFTKHGHRLFAVPHGLASKENSVELFQTILNDPRRSHPLVYVAPTADGRHEPDFKQIALILAGMAHVVVAEDVELAGAVARAMPGGLACPAGGIRVYWPDFHDHHDPRHHRAFADWEVVKMGRDCPYRLVDIIARQAVLRKPEGYRDWADLQSLHHRMALQSARNNDEALEMLKLFEEENLKQQTALMEANKEIARLATILSRARVEVERLGALLLDSEEAEPRQTIIPDLENASGKMAEEIHAPAVEDEQQDVDQSIAEDTPRVVPVPTGSVGSEEEVHTNELGVCGMTYFGMFAREIYEKARTNPKSGAGGPPPTDNRPKPDRFSMGGGIHAHTGDWFEDPNYGWGKILKINAGNSFGRVPDAHRVWLYRGNQGVIMNEHRLKVTGVRIVRDFQVPAEVIQAWKSYDSNL